MNECIRVIRSRRSVRAYKPEKLTRTQVDAIVEAGIWAPTAHNEQPWHFTVIQDRAVLSGINAQCKELMANVNSDWIRNIAENPSADITYGAPALVIVSSKRGAMTGRIDCAAAVQNMMLAAESMGVASCWMGLVGFLFGKEEEMERLGVPEGYEPLYAAVFGHAGDGAVRPAPPRRRDVVNYIGAFPDGRQDG